MSEEDREHWASLRAQYEAYRKEYRQAALAAGLLPEERKSNDPTR